MFLKLFSTTFLLYNDYFFVFKSYFPNFEVVRDAYEWLITWLVSQTQRKFEEGIAQGLDSFTARSRSQVYRAANLSKAYGEV